MLNLRMELNKSDGLINYGPSMNVPFYNFTTHFFDKKETFTGPFSILFTTTPCPVRTCNAVISILNYFIIITTLQKPDSDQLRHSGLVIV